MGFAGVAASGLAPVRGFPRRADIPVRVRGEDGERTFLSAFAARTKSGHGLRGCRRRRLGTWPRLRRGGSFRMGAGWLRAEGWRKDDASAVAGDRNVPSPMQTSRIMRVGGRPVVSCYAVHPSAPGMLALVKKSPLISRSAAVSRHPHPGPAALAAGCLSVFISVHQWLNLRLEGLCALCVLRG